MSLATTLMAVGIPAETANRIGYADRVPLDGNGTTQLGATEILRDNTNIAMGTSVGDTAFILPPDAEYFEPYFLLNTTAETALVFPPAGDTIDTGALNASVSIAEDTARIFQRVEEGRWVSILTGLSPETGIVASVVAGTGIAVDNTDPANPVVSNTGVLSVSAGSNVSITGTPENPIINSTNPGGTVTGVSVASANGFAGSSDGDPVNPELTLSTTVNSPLLAGNGTALSAAVPEDARNYLDTGPYVADRTALAALDPTKDPVAWLMEAGRAGEFQADFSDLSAQVAADTEQGIYVAFGSDTTGASGAWVREHDGSVFPEWFGATGGSNDTAAVQACFSLALAYGWESVLTDIYTTTSAVTIGAQTIRGTSKDLTGILGNHAGRVLEADNVSTNGLILVDFLLQGNGTTVTNGTSTGLWISSSTEETAHVHIRNVRFSYHAKGIDGTGTYVLFDSTLIEVDFYGCATWGEKLGGSQVTHVGCSYRLCGWGVMVDSPSSFSIGGGLFDGGIFIGNTYDVVFDTATVRPLTFKEVWFEQTVTVSFGRTAGGEHFMHSLVLEGCLFQPAATAAGNGVTDLPTLKGIFSIKDTIVYTDLYGSASLPGSSEYSGDSNLQFKRNNSATVNGSGTVTPLDDYSNSTLVLPSVNFGQDPLNYYDEGTFTPALSASGSTFAYGIQSGVYTRIGNRVFFGITIQLAAAGNTLSANPVTITGLPFTSNATNPASGFVLWSNSTTSYVQVTWRILGSSTSVTLYGITAAGTGNVTAVNSDALLHATNQTFIVLSGNYRV